MSVPRTSGLSHLAQLGKRMITRDFFTRMSEALCPPGFTIAAVTVDDLQAITALILSVLAALSSVLVITKSIIELLAKLREKKSHDTTES